MTAQKYIAVLEDRLVHQATDWFGNEEGTFMQDGAPCHTARAVMNYLRERNVTVLDWPGNSPDMNPIETLWGIMN